MAGTTIFRLILHDQISDPKRSDFSTWVIFISFSKEIEWLKEDEVKIESNEKYEIIKKEEKEFVQLILKIENIEIKDQGIYKCRSINEYGSAILLFHLRIDKNLVYFIENQFFYLTIFLGLFLSFLFFFLIFKYFFNSSKTNLNPQNNDQQIILQQSLIQNHIQVFLFFSLHLFDLYFRIY